MTTTWGEGTEITPEAPKGLAWLRVLRRGIPIFLVLTIGMILKLALRVIERPLFGMGRPVTPYITQAACRLSLFFMGIPVKATGPRIKGPGAVVANHSSWLDIFTLNSRKNVYFVSKAEVANWPGIGWLARATGTVFINRDRREAKAQTDLFETRLKAGHRLLFFPEGTSTDAVTVLPFKTTLFAAFFTEGLRDILQMQAVTVLYHAPEGADRRFYGWWGDMEFGAHLLSVLAAKSQGHVELIYHTPVKVSDFKDRKELARHLEAQVRGAHRLTAPEA
ncbi:lysophospholipid acyltransferase family protein [Pseudoprimorskyibacter insulae]|uniref:Phospholipid/glycerol acyltransferase domain-containing protein n=1 Tax=Pseudoprimorskyibacter insulae TaxID=1695997 RepID=A0A2R8AZ41_9RHOB|nr:lysophospholipid acyltransferase family protein [Pseudoprimorskyibacter insulae]SPF81302.1 hypothetical protein PRI8871_03124 [Pseudoprimorskyibacter insulae]